MDALTAALALVIAQVSIALVMTGAHVAARRERSTRYWAAAAVLISIGVLILIAGRGGQPVLRLIGNSCLVFGAIAQFWGLQIFYRQATARLGWVIGGGFSLLFALLLFSESSKSVRIVMLSATLLLVLVLSVRALLTGMQTRRTFGSVLTLGGIGLLMLNNIARIAAVLRLDPDGVPLSSDSSTQVT